MFRSLIWYKRAITGPTTLNLLIKLQAATGATLDSVGDTIRINVSDQNRRQLIRDGLVLKVAITPAPGLSQIRVAVLDPNTGNVGSLRMVPPAQP